MQRQATANEIALMDLVMVENWDRVAGDSLRQKGASEAITSFTSSVLCGQHDDQSVRDLRIATGR